MMCVCKRSMRGPLRIELSITPTAVRLMEALSIDMVTLDKTKFLTIIDTFSRYVQMYRIFSQQATEVCDKLINYYASYGFPETITSDNSTEFNNHLVKELLDLLKIKIHISAQYPQSK